MSDSPATPATPAVPCTWRSLLTGRWHRSSWVVAVLVLLFLVFCNLPGQRVMYIEIDGNVWNNATNSRFEHGWPFTWIVRPSLSVEFAGISLAGPPSCWTLWDDAPGFNWSSLAINMAAVIVLTLLAGAVFELWRRARARVWQLHLRDILIAVLVISLAGGWYASQQRRHARESRLVNDAQLDEPMPGMGALPNACGIVWYSYQPGGPTWLRELVGDEQFESLDRVVEVGVRRDGLAWAAELPDVRVVKVNGEVTTASLSHLQRLPRLELLDLWQAQPESFDPFTSNPFIPKYGDDPPADPTPRLRLPPLPGLRRLVVGNTRIEGLSTAPALEVLNWSGEPANESLLKELAAESKLRKLSLSNCTVAWHRLGLLASLPDLEQLELEQTTIDDENVKNVAALTRLRKLSITYCPFTGRGLNHLASLPRLESLEFYETNVSDDALPHLASFKNLRELNLSVTRVTEDAIPNLVQMKSLRQLSLPAGAYSEEGAKRLLEELPECQVSWTR